MQLAKKNMSIGRVAERTGLTVPTIRFYEEKGLIFPSRDQAGRRQFVATDIRRLSLVMVAQRLGFSLSEIEKLFEVLPSNGKISMQDWDKMSEKFEVALEDRLATLTSLRKRLKTCIGCGCLSLKKCNLVNESDHIFAKGSGPRFLHGFENN